MALAPPPPSGQHELRDTVAIVRPALLRAWAFSSVSALLVLASSVYMLEVYDRVLASRSLPTLLMLTLLVVLAYAVMETLEWIRNEMLVEAGHDMDRRISARLFDCAFRMQVLRMPMGPMQPHQDWRTIREFMTSAFVSGLMEIPVAVLFLVLVFMINPLLGWLTIGGAVVQVLIAALSDRLAQVPLSRAQMAAQQAQRTADGALRNAEIVAAMGMLGVLHTRWSAKQGEFLELQTAASRQAGMLQAASRFVQQVMSSALLGLAAWLLLQNQLSGGPGMMIVASIIGGRVLSPLVQMIGQWRSVIQARIAWRRLAELLAALPAGSPAMPLPAPRGMLSVEQLVAGPAMPPGQPPVQTLRGVQFALQPGELATVIGPTASGKTTLARLLVGFWPPLAGKVRLDGVDVNAWNKAELGPFVGYLPQSVEIFEGTLAQNVARFGDPVPELLQVALEDAGLEAFVASLPEGVNTRLGNDGATLSGGMRQRVALARAMYGNPVLVVLDEPNAHLDEAGDLTLSLALARLKARGAATVVISHRTSVLSQTDKILVLSAGAQQAFGPRDEVMAALSRGGPQGRGQPLQTPQRGAA